LEEAAMRAAVRKLGNSSGVIIPKSLLRELGIAEGDPVEMTLEADRIVLVPIKRRARAGWAEASQGVAEARDDALVWPEFGNAEDETLTW
jgi:antitoxin MazE